MSDPEDGVSASKAMAILMPGDEFLAAVGRVVAICAHIENTIGNLVCLAIGADFTKGGRFIVSQVSYGRMAEVLVKSIEFKLGGEQNEEIRLIKKLMGEIFAQRNEIVHGTLIGHPNAPLYVLASHKVPYSTASFRQISTKELDKLWKKALECLDLISVFFEKHEAVLRASADKHPEVGSSTEQADR